jgi:hypothetical protein
MMVILATTHYTTPTGVAGVSEYTEVWLEPRRSISFSTRSIEYSSDKTQGIRDGLMEVGVSHSSDETG